MDQHITELERRYQSDPSNHCALQQLTEAYRRRGWTHNGRSLDDWIDLLKTEPEASKPHNVPKAWFEALEAIADIGALAWSAIPQIFKRFEHSNSKLREHCVLALGAIGPQTDDLIPDMIGLIDHDHWGHHSIPNHFFDTLSKQLAELGPPVLEHLPAIQRRLRASFTSTRLGALKILNALDVNHNVKLSALTGALKDEVRQIRLYAAEQLEKLGSQAAAAIPDLIKSLDSDRDVQLRCIRALGHFGRQARAAAPKLFECLDQQDSSNKGALLDALHKIVPDSDDLLAIFHHAALYDTASIRHQALRQLTELDRPPESRLFPILAGLLDRDIRSRARQSRDKIFEELGLPIPSEESVDQQLSKSLESLPPETLALTFKQAFAAKAWRTRYLALQLIEEHGGLTELQPSLRALLDDERWEVRKIALYALHKSLPDGEDPLPPLIQALNDPHPFVVEAALFILAKEPSLLHTLADEVEARTRHANDDVILAARTALQIMEEGPQERFSQECP